MSCLSISPFAEVHRAPSLPFSFRMKDSLKYQLFKGIKSWVEESPLGSLVRCTQSQPPFELQYTSYLLFTYVLDPGVVVYSEKQAKKRDICSLEYEHSGHVICQHLGIIHVKGGIFFNWEICSEILTQHILIDALGSMWAWTDRILIHLPANCFEEVHARVSRGPHPNAMIYVFTAQTATRLRLEPEEPEDCGGASGEALMQLHCFSKMSPPCKVLVINEERLQERKRKQLQKLLPYGQLVMVGEEHRPQHLHIPPGVQIAETELGAEYLVGFVWKGIYIVEPSLWIQASSFPEGLQVDT